MSSPAQIPFVDTGNRLLAPVDADLETGTVTGAGGAQKGVLTIRTASTTVTVMLDPPELRRWSGVISGLARTISDAGLAVPQA